MKPLILRWSEWHDGFVRQSVGGKLCANSVFPNKFDRAALEVHATTRRMTLAALLKTIAPSYEPREAPPVSITVNDEIIEAHRWAEFEFASTDDVEVRVEPKGVVPALAAVIAAILVAVVMSRNMAAIPAPSLP